MNYALRNKIIKENKFYSLLESNKQYRLQEYCMKTKKVVVGIIQGDPEKYNTGTGKLTFKYFDTWENAYTQLSQ